MMKLRVWAAIVSVGCMLGACSLSDDVLETQEANMLKYLGSNRITDFDPLDGVFRFVPNKSRESYDTDPVVGQGDSVYLMYEQYTFTTSKGKLYFTNKEALIDSDTILNRQFWSFKPLGVAVGATELIRGLQEGLPGCRQGDSVVLLITSGQAYGGKTVGVVPANTALMMVLNIMTVKK